ncbi:MAG: DUF3737 family protein [Clostridiales bacterium]|nr:DUF3737 family protein [Clostridiales bacterium]
MKKEEGKIYVGERALFAVSDLHLTKCVFEDGESPLKHCSNLQLDNCQFKWKYPLWYGKSITVNKCDFDDTARAGIWYTDGITVNDCVISAPKTFRRSSHIALNGVTMPNAMETLWNCDNVTISNVEAHGTYFAMGCKNVVVEDFTLNGDYCFDGAQNVTIKRAKLISKDSFWNCTNVTVYDSYISGEYLAWNASNVTFVNCTIESLQGLCFIDNLKLVNCRLVNTTRAFEYSSVEADIVGHVDSIVNPASGSIVADSIGELVLDDKYIDLSKVSVTQRSKS